MCALVYGLNDCDERVRREAADEIGDQLRKNPCCCSAEIVAALTAALGDCDKGVRREAEQGLRACGYDVVDGCCDKGKGCCKTGCGASACGACGAAPAAAAAPAPEAKDAAPAPAPAPPEEPKAYFPTRLNDQQTTKGMKSKLANLFGLRS